jgi:hypothetical protein
MDRIKEKYNDVLSDLDWLENDGILFLNSISINKNNRNKGIGTSIMKEVIKYAKSKGKEVHLVGANVNSQQRKRLENFYVGKCGMKKYVDNNGFVCYKI